MLTIYHNPRCSKSRQTLQIIRDQGAKPEIILYLEDPLSVQHIQSLLAKLGFDDPRLLMRRGEADYKANNLKAVDDPDKLVQAMADFPKLIERPIVVKGEQAVLGRPPENVLELLD